MFDESLADFVALYRLYCDLHRNPELSFAEWKSAERIATFLREEGIEVRSVAGTGLLAVVRGELPDVGEKPRAVVLRAELDALPVTECATAEIRSEREGVMHACGHDLHSTALVGALLLLNRRRSDFSGVVFGLFQPGEECNPGGASMVLAENPFEGCNVVAALAEHSEPALPTGCFGFRAGRYMASSDELRFTVRGKGGHAALRDGMIDPVPAAAKLIGMLHEIPSMAPDKSVPTILSIGKVEAAGATNVVPDEVYMEGTMRAFSEEWRREIKMLIRKAAAEIEEQTGTKIEVNISDGYPCVDNDKALTDRVKAVCIGLFGEEQTVSLGLRPTADDFGFIAGCYQAVYYRLGVGGDGDYFREGRAGKLHRADFCPDKRAIGFGSMMLASAALDILSNRSEA
ncbi:MAG: amidohydrolase [Tidjanibacter sp.]|nr:amidohydrolase [Tidjanibacter sp.]